MSRKPGETERIDAEAAAWLARRDAGLGPEGQAEFERWRASDPRHAEAVAGIEAAWRLLGGPAAGRVRAELKARARRRAKGAAGAFLLAAAACASVLLLRRSPVPAASVPAAPVTARVVGPERRILDDGSVVSLRAGSRVEADFGGQSRRVRLIQGEALFEVAKDATRPFLVDAGSVEVRAVGTAFSVALAPRNVEVLVTEGRVAVGGPAAAKPALVSAGNRLVVATEAAAFSPEAPVPAPPEEIETRLAWTVPRMEFTDTTLAEAASLFNRHNRMQIRIGDAGAAAHRVTGIFREDNVEGFVSLLESGMDVRAERLADGNVVLFSNR